MNVHIIASGRVHGVGFRFVAKQKAHTYDIKGCVRNLEDGKVELEIEGDETDIHSYMRKLKKGSHPFIRIDDMQVTTSEIQKQYNTFEIK